MNEPEARLIEKAKSGDSEAFGGLAATYWSRLVRLARSMVGEVAAEDVVQECLVVAWKKLRSLRNPDSFRPWVTRIVYRACLRMGRRREETFLERPEGEIDNSVQPDSAIWVQQVLSRLAPRQRAVMHLTLVEGYTDREIADLLGITSSSVRSHRRRARESLSELQEGSNGEER